MFKSIEKINCSFKEKNEDKSVAETQLYQEILKVFLQSSFRICLSPIPRKDLLFWSKLQELCQMLVDWEILIHIWKTFVLSLIINLVDNLYCDTDEELKVFSDSNLFPFKDLGMKNEYKLQILLNAFNSKDDPKYAEVIKLKIYKDTFENWIRLLKLIKIPTEPNNVKNLQNYVESNIHSNKNSDRGNNW